MLLDIPLLSFNLTKDDDEDLQKKQMASTSNSFFIRLEKLMKLDQPFKLIRY